MKYICNICGQSFTRKWNLQRHLRDVDHDVIDKKYIAKEDIDNRYSLPINNNRYNSNFSNTENNMKEIYPNQNFSNNNNFRTNFPPYGYNNVQPYPYPYQYPYLPFINPITNSQPNIEKEEWTQNDRIKMQKALEILRNRLKKIHHPRNVSKIIKYLHYRCLDEKSIEPLKKYFVNNYLGAFWPYDD